MLSKFIRLMPKNQVYLLPWRVPLVETPSKPLPWFPLSVKFLSETFIPRAGAGGPGSGGTPASGGPLWIPSLLVPVFTKNPVPQPRPAMFQYPPAGRNRPEINALPSMISVIGFDSLAAAMEALIRGASSVAAPPVCLLRPFFRLQSKAHPIFDAQMYVIPVTGTGGSAGPKQGISKPESQPVRKHPRAEPAANRPVFRRKVRLSIRYLPALLSLATGC